MVIYKPPYPIAYIRKYLISVFTIFSAYSSISQTADSNFVKRYAKENDIEASSDWRSYRFRFLSTKHAGRKDFSLVSNSMLYTGATLDYKWLSVGYGFNVPGTERDKSSAHRDLFLQLDDIDHLIIWQAYFKKYNGLLEPLNSRRNHFNKYTGVHLTDIGSSILFPLNHKTFSYNAARYLNQQQLHSSGSVIFSFNPFYHRVKISDSIPQAKDQKAMHFLKSSPRWLTSAFSIGYAYNFIGSDSRWNLSPELDVGYGLSRFLKPSLQWTNALQYNAEISFGYSSKLFYSYLTAFYHNFRNRFAQESVGELNSGVSFTCGYRIGSLKKKIFKVL